MVFFANAKINIGLHILNKRKDEFHNIESIFYPIPLYDVLEFSILKNSSNYFKFVNTGITVNSKPQDNLTVKAFMLLREKFNLPKISIHLHKNIPFGAGLGGGSSDAAFMINALNKFFKLKISVKDRILLADSLGSDCGFFIQNKPSYVTGKGEKIEPISLSLKSYYLLLIQPNEKVNTKDAYRNIVPDNSRIALKSIDTNEINSWKMKYNNDFEKSIFEKYPVISQVKKTLYEFGAKYASMSGSGSSVYGIFDFEPKFENVFPKAYFIWQKKL